MTNKRKKRVCLQFTSIEIIPNGRKNGSKKQLYDESAVCEIDGIDLYVSGNYRVKGKEIVDVVIKNNDNNGGAAINRNVTMRIKTKITTVKLKDPQHHGASSCTWNKFIVEVDRMRGHHQHDQEQKVNNNNRQNNKKNTSKMKQGHNEWPSSLSTTNRRPSTKRGVFGKQQGTAAASSRRKRGGGNATDRDDRWWITTMTTDDPLSADEEGHDDNGTDVLFDPSISATTKTTKAITNDDNDMEIDDVVEGDNMMKRKNETATVEKSPWPDKNQTTTSRTTTTEDHNGQDMDDDEENQQQQAPTGSKKRRRTTQVITDSDDEDELSSSGVGTSEVLSIVGTQQLTTPAVQRVVSPSGTTSGTATLSAIAATAANNTTTTDESSTTSTKDDEQKNQAKIFTFFSRLKDADPQQPSLQKQQKQQQKQRRSSFDPTLNNAVVQQASPPVRHSGSMLEEASEEQPSSSLQTPPRDQSRRQQDHSSSSVPSRPMTSSRKKLRLPRSSVVRQTTKTTTEETAATMIQPLSDYKKNLSAVAIEDDPIEEFDGSITTSIQQMPRRRILRPDLTKPDRLNRFSLSSNSVTPGFLPRSLTPNIHALTPSKSSLITTTTATPRTRKKNPFRGLRNLGNSCYINSSLQMLCTLTGWIDSLDGRGGQLTRSVVNVARQLSANEGGMNQYSVNPRSIKEAIDKKTKKFAGYEQRDAHEFLSDMIDHIHEELKVDNNNNNSIEDNNKNRNHPSTSKTIMTTNRPNGKSDVVVKADTVEADEKVVSSAVNQVATEAAADQPVSSALTGHSLTTAVQEKTEMHHVDKVAEDEEQATTTAEQGNNEKTSTVPQPPLPTDHFLLTVQVRLKCLSCGYTRCKEEMYRHLSIDIVDEESNDEMDHISTNREMCSSLPVEALVEKGLSRFFQPETRELKCEKCDEGEESLQTLRILKRPTHLLLHLKRFLIEEIRPSTYSSSAVSDENQQPNTPPRRQPAPVRYEFRKKKDPVMISESLTLQAFQANETENDKEVLATEHHATYHLKSIVHHIGNRASQGHYTADAVRRVTTAAKGGEPSIEDGSDVDNEDTTVKTQALATTCINIEDEDKKVIQDNSGVTDNNPQQQGEMSWISFDDSSSVRTTWHNIVSNKNKRSSAYMLLYSTV